MYHVFTIHSHITLLSALATIKFEEISKENVILICGDGYKTDIIEELNISIVESFDTFEAKQNFWARLKMFNYTKYVNKYIDNLVKEEKFVAYIDLMSVFNRYLTMHKNCVGFHIIEEGIVNYADFDDFNLWTADLKQFAWQWTGIQHWKQMLLAIIRILRGRSLRLLAIPIHPNLYTLHKNVKAYCFSDFAFSYTAKENKKIISFTSVLTFINIDEGEQLDDGSWIWIGDTIASTYKISIAHFEEAMYKLMCEVNPGKEKKILYLKFRGPEPKEEKEATTRLLTNFNFEIKFLEAKRIMELDFLCRRNLKVMGIASSLLIYANLMGHETFSMFKYIPNIYNISIASSYQTISKKVGLL